MLSEEKVEDVLRRVDRAGITLALKPGGLLNAKPTAALTPELVAELKEHKAEIIRILLEDAERERERERDLARAAHLGLVARWGIEFGFIAIHDSTRPRGARGSSRRPRSKTRARFSAGLRG